jgi:hypothetical protein
MNMEELNTAQTVAVADEDGFDALTIVNMGEAFSMAQVDEEGDMHNVVIGPAQAEALIKQLVAFLG